MEKLRFSKRYLFVQIFRHGDRTPIEVYPNDPWKDQEWWPVGFGELTNVSFKLKWVENQNFIIQRSTCLHCLSIVISLYHIEHCFFFVSLYRKENNNTINLASGFDNVTMVQSVTNTTTLKCVWNQLTSIESL